MAAMADRPNILLITSDQQHFSTLGCINPAIRTPALDRLAAEGMRFDRAYCPNPLCSPSRASILTGQYPAWHGCWTLGTKLDEQAPTVSGMFTEAGYATHLIGKAHLQPLRSDPRQTSLECQPTLRDLDFWRRFTGPWYGFERIELARNHGDESHVGQHYAAWMEDKGLKDWREYFQPLPGEERGRYCPPAPPRPDRYYDRSDRTWKLPEEFHYSVWTAERTLANIEAALGNGKPFFTWASFHDPHPPYIVPEPWASMYDPADMELPAFDPAEFESMPPAHREALKPHGVADFSPWQETPHGNHGFHSHEHDPESLRIDMACYYGMTSFMDAQIGRILEGLDRLGVADNTLVLFTTDHGHFLGHHGLIAKGAFHYEDLLKLPYLVRWPGRVPAGQSSEAIQSLVDLAPSFLGAAGLEIPGRMQGVNQLDVWQGRAPSARNWAICENRHQPTKLHLRTFITDRYKITIYRGETYGELFDLVEDPEERRNLWDDPAHRPVRAELFQRFLDAELQREPTPYPRICGA